MGIRAGKGGSGHEMEVLIQWKGLPSHESTWEPYELVQEQFPDFHLEDKVTLWAGSDDKPPIRFTYVRGKKKGYFG